MDDAKGRDFPEPVIKRFQEYGQRLRTDIYAEVVRRAIKDVAPQIDPKWPPSRILARVQAALRIEQTDILLKEDILMDLAKLNPVVEPKFRRFEKALATRLSKRAGNTD